MTVNWNFELTNLALAGVAIWAIGSAAVAHRSASLKTARQRGAMHSGRGP